MFQHFECFGSGLERLLEYVLCQQRISHDDIFLEIVLKLDSFCVKVRVEFV